jgi:hypothetical protein
MLGLLERKDWNYVDGFVVLGKQEIGLRLKVWLVMLKVCGVPLSTAWFSGERVLNL